MKIWPKNVESAFSPGYKDLIRGFGVAADGTLYMEYRISSSSKKRQLAALIKEDSLVVYHTCRATQDGKPCWHLGALAYAAGVDVPVSIDIENTQVNPVKIQKDVTDEILDRPGDFELLEVGEVESSPEPVVELPEELEWLKRYRLPEKVFKKVLSFRESQLENLTDEQKRRIPQPGYVPSGSELICAVSSLVYGKDGGYWEAPLLIGPKGSGKSTMAETLAAVFLLPVTKIFGGIDLNSEALLGARTLVPTDDMDIITEAKLRSACRHAGVNAESIIQKIRGSQMKVGFEPGPLTRAVENGELVIIDEINMLVPEVTSLLHGLLDWQKTLQVPGYGTIYAPSTFRLVGCMNMGYSGTKVLNEAFQDRFRSVSVPHLSYSKLAELIRKETGTRESASEKLAMLFESLAKGVDNGDLSEKVLSVRALFRVAREELDGCGTLKSIAASVLTDGLDDTFEISQVSDTIESQLGGS
ncbi:MAG: AAA family ATPase [Clostridiales bacterium]|nr:AAA family ATPase [Clostridiales bacterium]MCF8022644.1 AAA family ATPase [Clostridiales bacterium]